MRIIKMFLVAVIAVCVLTMTVFGVKTSSHYGDVGTGNRFTTATVSGVATIATGTGSVMLAANGGRSYARFQNDDATINIWLCLAATCAINTGIKLTPGSSYTIDQSNLYVGPVWAIAASGTPVLDITTNP